MMCPSEYTCSVFAEGELPETEAREIARHLENCKACDRLVAALRAESRLLVQCLQDIDLDEAVEVPTISAVPQRLSVLQFTFWILGAALAFRLSTGILFGLQLPADLEWLDPRAWALNLGVFVDAVVYAIQNGPFAVSGAIEATVFVAFAMALFAGMAYLFRRSPAVSTVFGVLLAIGLFSSPSYAIDIRKGAAASIPAGETVDDTVVLRPEGTNNSIVVAGTVKGDVIAVGDVVTISGNVDGNVIAGARRVEISGNVTGSLLGAAQTVMVSGHVGRNFAGFATNLNVAKSTVISGNAAVFSSDLLLDGRTERDLLAFAALADLRGDVGRNVVIRGGQVHVSAPARIGGDFTAHVPKEENARIDSGVVIAGKKDIQVVPRTQGPSRYFTLSFYVWQIVRILAAFITGLILFRLFPWLLSAGLTSGKDWLKAGGLGFAVLVAVPIAAIIVGITVIGLPIALLSIFLWVAGLYLSKIIVAEFVGRSLMKTSGAVPLLAGLLLVIVAVNLPWIGGLINFLLCLLGLGAITIAIYKAVTRRHELTTA
jgi:cytoskeletal protein CcmA (bactofilin family)